MIKLLTASAATLLTVTVVASPGARACDEDCVYELQEAADERAYERAYAREEAEEEEGYAPSRRGASRSARRRGQAQRAEMKKAAQDRRLAEPKPTTPSQSQPRTTPRSKVATENSSIAGSESEVAEDNSFGRPRLAKELGCKTFFPSVGMTLTVPCD